jgi:hypothetical protein
MIDRPEQAHELEHLGQFRGGGSGRTGGGEWRPRGTRATAPGHGRR